MRLVFIGTSLDLFLSASAASVAYSREKMNRKRDFIVNCSVE